MRGPGLRCRPIFAYLGSALVYGTPPPRSPPSPWRGPPLLFCGAPNSQPGLLCPTRGPLPCPPFGPPMPFPGLSYTPSRPHPGTPCPAPGPLPYPGAWAPFYPTLEPPRSPCLTLGPLLPHTGTAPGPPWSRRAPLCPTPSRARVRALGGHERPQGRTRGPAMGRGGARRGGALVYTPDRISATQYLGKARGGPRLRPSAKMGGPGDRGA